MDVLRVFKFKLQIYSIHLSILLQKKQLSILKSIPCDVSENCVDCLKHPFRGS